MKKFLMSLFLLVCAIPHLTAQSKIDDRLLEIKMADLLREKDFWENWPYKFEVRVGWGGMPVMDDYYYLHDDSLIYGPGYDRPDGLEGLYAPQKGNTYMTGQIFGEFSWHIKRRLTLAGGIYVNGIYGTYVDPDNGKIIRPRRGVSVTMIPSVRLYWSNYDKVRFYSEFGLGVNVAAFDGEKNVIPAVHSTPVGITAGRKVFIFAEYSVGTVCLGGKVGLGYRF